MIAVSGGEIYKRRRNMPKIRNNAKEVNTSVSVPVRRIAATGEVTESEQIIVRENVLEVSVNGLPAFRLTCTPDHLTELVFGRLCTEQIIREAEDVAELFICGEGNIAELTLREEAAFQPHTGAEPTCCTGNRQYVETEGRGRYAVLPEVTPEPAEVFRLAEHFNQDGKLHRNTGGTHSCYIRLGDGSIEAFEDIGRHNAMDKAVGHMLLTGNVPADCMLFTTGRVAADMAEKAIAAGIPVLISKAVPTDEAVRLAEEYHLTLICRAWPDSFELYGRI